MNYDKEGNIKKITYGDMYTTSNEYTDTGVSLGRTSHIDADKLLQLINQLIEEINLLRKK